MSKKYNAIHPIDLYAGKRLRLARELCAISQTRLSELSPHPVTFQQIQKYERGINRMAISRLWDFAQVLYLPISFFLPDTSNETTPLLPHEKALADCYKGLSINQQKLLIRFLEHC